MTINRSSLGIGPLQGRERKNVLKRAIDGVDLPWLCSEEVKKNAKKIAINAAINGLIAYDFIDSLVPNVFKTKREAKHSMAKLGAVGLNAVTYYDWHEIGLEKYQWIWSPDLCDYPDHESKHLLQFDLNSLELPSSKYGCRCRAAAIFKDSY